MILRMPLLAVICVSLAFNTTGLHAEAGQLTSKYVGYALIAAAAAAGLGALAFYGWWRNKPERLRSELLKAVREGDAVAFEIILHQIEAWPEVRKWAFSWFNSWLCDAAKHGHVNLVSLLLSKGAAVGCKSMCLADKSPLHLAAEHGHEGMVRLLLEHGACVDAKDCNKLTPLYHALLNGHDAVALLLYEKSEHLSNEWGRLLGQAAAGGATEMVRFFLGQGVSQQDTLRALYNAVEGGRREAVEVLFDAALAFTDGDTLDCTVEALHLEDKLPLLHTAARYGQAAIVRFLLDKGAHIDEHDDWNAFTPLHWAVGGRISIGPRKGAVEAARVLLWNGADTALKNKHNKTALDCILELDGYYTSTETSMKVRVDQLSQLIFEAGGKTARPWNEEKLARLRRKEREHVQAMGDLLGFDGPGQLPNDLVRETLLFAMRSKEALEGLIYH